MEPSDTSARPARLAVGVVGTGRVGCALGAAWHRAGHRVIAASRGSERSRRRAQEWLPNVPLLQPGEVVARAGLALLTVPDEVLPDLAAELAASGAVAAGQLVVHTSGRRGTAVLDPCTRQGALPLALHPMMTFTGRGDDAARLSGCFFGVTAPEALRPAAEALVVETGGEPAWVPEGSRALYHTALAAGANHLATLVAESVALLGRAGVSEPERAIAPLLQAALDNALRSGVAGVTGPAARGDADTVAAHLDELRYDGPESTETLAAYVALARLTADRALQAGLLAPEDAERLLDVLAGPEART